MFRVCEVASVQNLPSRIPAKIKMCCSLFWYLCVWSNTIRVYHKFLSTERHLATAQKHKQCFHPDGKKTRQHMCYKQLMNIKNSYVCFQAFMSSPLHMTWSTHWWAGLHLHLLLWVCAGPVLPPCHNPGWSPSRWKWKVRFLVLERERGKHSKNKLIEKCFKFHAK